MLLGGIFRAHDTPQKLFATLSAPKAAHNARDLARWAELFGVELTMPGGHPLRTVEALRATIAAGIDPRVIHGFYRAYWVDGREPSAPDTMRDVLTSAGHDADRILAAITTPEARDDLRRRTDEAIALGVFGAPAYVVDGAALYWGQDRAELVAEALGAFQPPPAKGASMGHSLAIYWDFSSPFAYLGSTQAEALAARHGVTLEWRPMLLGGLFKAVGQVDVPLFTWSDAKKKHTFEDLHRWAAHWSVPFKFPSRFPMNSLKAMRAYLALPEERRPAFRERVFRAYWAEDRDISDDAVLAECIGEGAAGVLAKTQDPAVKKELIEATEKAAAAGVCGAPTWVVDDKELLWGQDRIPLVERALAT